MREGIESAKAGYALQHNEQSSRAGLLSSTQWQAICKNNIAPVSLPCCQRDGPADLYSLLAFMCRVE